MRLLAVKTHRAHRRLSNSLYLLLTLGALSLAACQNAPTAQSTSSIVQPLPSLPVANSTRYLISEDESDIRFLVYRDGPFGFLGHNHVVQAKHFTGEIYLAPEFNDSGFSLNLPVDKFVIDASEARASEGPDFSKQPSESDVAETREHMLGPDALDAADYPDIHIRSVNLERTGNSSVVTVRIDFHGVTRDLTVPIAIEQLDDRIVVTGEFQLKQTDYSIKPFSFLGGAIRVADIVNVHFKIVGLKGA